MKQSNKILVIDDELSTQPKHPLKGQIESFASGIGFTAEFIEAPVEIDDAKDIGRKYNPTVIFLDIVHNNRPCNVAKLIKNRIREADSEIPVLILSNYSEADLDKMNKLLKEQNKRISSELENIRTEIKGSIENLANWDVIVKEAKHFKFIETFLGLLSKYKKGETSKHNVIEHINNSPAAFKDLKPFKKIKVFLSATKIPDILVAYSISLKQIIGYVLKETFKYKDVQLKISNGILACTNSLSISLAISGRNINIRDMNSSQSWDYTSGADVSTLKMFENKDMPVALYERESTRKTKKPVTIQDQSLEMKAARIASDLNKNIKNQTTWRVQELLKNDGYGKYKLAVDKFVVDNTVRWAPIIEAPEETYSLQHFKEDISAMLTGFEKKLSGFDERLERLEGKKKK